MPSTGRRTRPSTGWCSTEAASIPRAGNGNGREFCFTLGSLGEFLEYLKEHRSIIRLCDAPQDGAGIILRHDVDLDIAPAYRVAELEKGMGIRSSFFILTTCGFYNPSSQKNRAMLREMAEDGFDIGLHFDPTVYPGGGNGELLRGMRRERELLEHIINAPVRSISLHNPSIHGEYVLFPEMLNAYDPEYFNPQIYISDSQFKRSFIGRDVHEFVRTARQMLLHPCQYPESDTDFKGIGAEAVARLREDVERTFRGLM